MIRRPHDAAVLGMIGLEQLTWPITYTYFISAPWGETQQRLTVNVPQLEGQEEATKRLGPLLWSVLTAPAVVGDVSMYVTFITNWRNYGVPVPYAGIEGRGNLIGLAAPRDQTPQIVMLTDHITRGSHRRLFLPGAPRSWSSGGMLTREGWEHLLPHAAGCLLGLAEPELLSGLEWLIPFPGVLESTLTNLPGVAFKRVKHLRVCQHTDKAPGPSAPLDL